MPDAKGHGDMHLAGVLRTSLGVQLCLEGSRWASWSKPRPAPEPLSNAKAEITRVSYRMCWVTLARPKALFTGNENRHRRCTSLTHHGEVDGSWYGLSHQPNRSPSPRSPVTRARRGSSSSACSLTCM